MKKYAVEYLRVSSEEQVKNFSLDNQKEYCKRAIEQKEYTLLKIFKEEGKSAKTLKRPALVELLSYCKENKHKIAAVFVYRYDRLSRNSYQALAIKHKLSQLGIEVLSATEPTGDDPMGKFIQTLSFALAQLDNDIRSQRTLDGMRKRFEAGLPHGKVPVGYLNAKDKLGRCTVIRDPDQFKFVKRTWSELATGTYTVEMITDLMNELGIKIKRGNKIYKVRPQHAHRIFRNKFYIGILVSKRWGEKQGIHKPMVSEELFYRVQAILEGRAHKTAPKGRRNADFPLRR